MHSWLAWEDRPNVGKGLLLLEREREREAKSGRTLKTEIPTLSWCRLVQK
jgi:hypothetical protein